MCFSASASFGMGTVLLVTGIVSVKKVNAPSQILFASIPLLFSIQQYTEGFVWLGLTDPDDAAWLKPSTYIFLAFAQVIWPIWVPSSILAMEKNKNRKKALAFVTLWGGMVSAYLAYCLFNLQVNADIHSHHISYHIAFPSNIFNYGGIFYFIPTVIPPFLSAVKRHALLGYINIASYLVTKLFFHDEVISVWCFFAAMLSAAILLLMYKENKSAPESVIIH